MSYTLAATPLADTPWIAMLIFTFALLSIFSLGRYGFLRQQWQYVFDTRSTRMFEEVMSEMWMWRLLTLAQTFLMCGLCLFVSFHPGVAALSEMDGAGFRDLMLCITFPLGWFIFQWLCFWWMGYLFNCVERVAILNRIYLALHSIVGPFLLLLFFAMVSCHISAETTTILLLILFVLTQLMLVFSVFKIFFGGIATLCLIILYLCTLEIAPLVILFQKTIA